ncbi:hypothetical protein Tco_0679648 [Tanacetum coccineum]|uniref:Uncharacterized protein n=1 Tax=Tanacetum coccineum TaxID=301880 RepID=A0ABQ4XIP3_9ASTR
MVEKSMLNNKGKITGPMEIRLVWDNTARVNHQSKLTHPHPTRNFIPAAVLTKSGQVPVNAAKQSSHRAAISISAAKHVNTVAPRPNVNDALPTTYVYFKAYSPVPKSKTSCLNDNSSAIFESMPLHLVMSDSEESGITHTTVSSLYEDLSDIGSPRADDHELLEPPYMLEDPYAEAALQAPPSPDYVPGPEEPEQAPPSPDYVPGPELADDEIVAGDQPYAEDASPMAHSPDDVPESDPEADPEEDDDEDPEEDPIDYSADGGDDGDDRRFTKGFSKIANAPIRALPEGSEDFIVYCDALIKGLGVVLMQKREVTMSSATSDVTYTSVYTDSEPGRAFWGADYEGISEGGIPRVIDLILPAPQMRRAQKLVHTAHDPTIPPVAHPLLSPPGYITESDPEEDPMGYKDDEAENGDETRRMRRRRGKEKEQLASADCAHASAWLHLLIPPPSTTSGCLTQTPDSHIASTQALIDAVTAALPPPPLPPLPPSLPIPSPVDRRDDIPESEHLPQEVKGMRIGFVSTVRAEEGDRDQNLDTGLGILGRSAEDLDRVMVEEEPKLPARACSFDRYEPGNSVRASDPSLSCHFEMTDRRRQDQCRDSPESSENEAIDERMQLSCLAALRQRRTAGQSGPEARIRIPGGIWGPASHS